MSEIFWKKVRRGAPDECWPWTGYIGPSGHGRTTYKSLNILASRKAWILTHGLPPSDLCVNHRCDNAACCNPDHMYLGTRADNMIDRWTKAAHSERQRRDIPFALTVSQIRALYQLRRRGATLKQCAEAFGVCTMTVVRIVTAYRRGLLRERQAVKRLTGDV